MKKLYIIIFLTSCSILGQTLPTVVNNVDLTKYAGTWYEILKIPNSFQGDCDSNTTATYTLLPDGNIEVINQCYNKDGEVDRAEGIARIVDEKTNAKLEVSFVSFLGWRPFWGDYWIIGVDENYQWAIVGHPKRKYGWILSRTPTISDKAKEVVFEILVKNGYNIEDFE